MEKDRLGEREAYEEVEVEVIEFERADVITTSPEGGDASLHRQLNP